MGVRRQSSKHCNAFFGPTIVIYKRMYIHVHDIYMYEVDGLYGT